MDLNSNLAPIILFTFNRLDPVKQTISHLQKNDLSELSDLIIFSDGPRTEEERLKVLSVRSFLKTISGFKSITIKENVENKGLANNIISGVTEILNVHGKCIVLEDDLVTSPHFLKYMNESLELYKDSNNVASIHGYIYPIQGLPDFFFLKGADCWGWATWKRSWDFFEVYGSKLLNKLDQSGLEKESNFDNSYQYSNILREQIKGHNNSWAIRWYYSCFLNNMLTLYPGKSYVQNIGFGYDATHCSSSGEIFKGEFNDNDSFPKVNTEEDKHARNLVSLYFKSIKSSFLKRVLNKMRTII